MTYLLTDTQRPMQACFSEGEEALHDIIICYNCITDYDTSRADQISIGGGENEKNLDGRGNGASRDHR